jgi:hypothetical protein
LPRVDATFPTLRRRQREATERSLGQVFGALVDDARERWQAGVPTLITAAWDRRVADVILDRSRDIAGEVGALVAAAFPDQQRASIDMRLMEPYLTEYARVAGENINATTRASLADISDLDELEHVLGNLLGWRLPRAFGYTLVVVLIANWIAGFVV